MEVAFLEMAKEVEWLMALVGIMGGVWRFNLLDSLSSCISYWNTDDAVDSFLGRRCKLAADTTRGKTEQQRVCFQKQDGENQIEEQVFEDRIDTIYT